VPARCSWSPTCLEAVAGSLDGWGRTAGNRERPHRDPPMCTQSERDARGVSARHERSEFSAGAWVGPRRSQLLPATPRKTATRPSASSRALSEKLRRRPLSCADGRLRSRRPRTKNPTRPAVWLPTIASWTRPSARQAGAPLRHPVDGRPPNAWGDRCWSRTVSPQ
jgi:hypothetical protein